MKIMIGTTKQVAADQIHICHMFPLFKPSILKMTSQ